MNLGFLSAILPEYTLSDLADFASGLGLDCLEVACWPRGGPERRYAGVTHIDADRLGPKEVESIHSLLAEKNISISALGYYPNPLDPVPSRREASIRHLKKVIAAANKLGIKNVNTFVGRDPSASLAESMKTFKKIWPDIVSCAEDQNIKIGIENCPMLFTQDEWPGGKNLASAPAIWADMFSVIDSGHFGLNYDPSHLVWQRMDYIAPIYDFAEKIFHFHIKDVRFYQNRYDKVGIFAPPLAYHAPKLPGLGDIDWGNVFSALYDIRYTGSAVIEVEDRSFENTLQDKLHSIDLSLRYIRNFL
jgi:sugar phosphate isomerase/epimerase